jgi:hypothetical protein
MGYPRNKKQELPVGTDLLIILTGFSKDVLEWQSKDWIRLFCSLAMGRK